MNYYSIPQAAKLLGRTRQDVWYLVKNNKIPSIKIGRQYALTEEDINNHFLKRLGNKTTNNQTITISSTNNNIKD